MNFVKGLYGASLGQFGRRLFGFAANLYLLTRLTPQAMGEFVILQFITLQIPFWVGNGLNMALVRDGKDLPLDVKRTAITIELLASFALAYSLWAATGSIQSFYAASGDFVVRYLPWMLALVPLLVVKQFLTAQWQSRLAFNKTTSADLIEHIGYLVVAIALSHFVDPVVALITAFAFGRLTSLVYLAVGFRSWGLFLPRFRVRELRPLIQFGSYVQLGHLCNQLAEAVLPLVLGKVGGTASVGLATWVMRIVWIPQSITNYVDGIAFATFCRMRPTSRRYRWVQTTLAQALVAFTGAYLVGLNLFYPQLLHHLFGLQWQGTRAMVFLFSCYILSYSACTVVVQSIFAGNGAKFLFKMSLASVASFWTLGSAFIYFGGALGYGIFYFLLIAYSAAIYHYAIRHNGFRWREALLKPLAAAVAPALAVVAARFAFGWAGKGLFETSLEASFIAAASLALHYILWGKAAIRIARDRRRAQGLPPGGDERRELRKAG